MICFPPRGYVQHINESKILSKDWVSSQTLKIIIVSPVLKMHLANSLIQYRKKKKAKESQKSITDAKNIQNMLEKRQ